MNNKAFYVSLVALVFSLPVLGFAFGQNASNGTDTTTGGTTTGIASLLGLLASIGTIMGTIGVILSKFPWTWSRRVSKYAMTYGQKMVDVTEDNYHLAMAVDAATNGEVEKNLKRYGKTMDTYSKRFRAANEQAKYLDPSHYLPVNPNDDADMPREDNLGGSSGGISP